MLSKEQLEKIANPVLVDVGSAQNPIVTQMAIELLSLREQLAELKALPPVAWRHDTIVMCNRIITTGLVVMRSWVTKGYKVTQLFTAAKPAEVE